jgi:dTDP-4-amino-4,6-dideoxygalactose transaminase
VFVRQRGLAHGVATAGIAPGDEVITSGITDIGTVIGVLFQQAVPVFAISNRTR